MESSPCVHLVVHLVGSSRSPASAMSFQGGLVIFVCPWLQVPQLGPHLAPWPGSIRLSPCSELSPGLHGPRSPRW